MAEDNEDDDDEVEGVGLGWTSEVTVTRLEDGVEEELWAADDEGIAAGVGVGFWSAWAGSLGAVAEGVGVGFGVGVADDEVVGAGAGAASPWPCSGAGAGAAGRVS